MLRKTMRRPAYVFVVLVSFTIISCGKEMITSRDTNSRTMSEAEAFETLSALPEVAPRNAVGKASASSQELVRLLKELVESGKITLPSNHRHAIGSGGSVDLSQLTNILSLVQSGQANSIGSLVSGLTNIAGGSTGGMGGQLGGIMQLLQMAMPFISMIAPQYAPMITALTTILPLVMGLFGGIFKKKSRSAEWHIVLPRARFA